HQLTHYDRAHQQHGRYGDIDARCNYDNGHAHSDERDRRGVREERLDRLRGEEVRCEDSQQDPYHDENAYEDDLLGRQRTWQYAPLLLARRRAIARQQIRHTPTSFASAASPAAAAKPST